MNSLLFIFLFEVFVVVLPTLLAIIIFYQVKNTKLMVFLLIVIFLIAVKAGYVFLPIMLRFINVSY